ncbi:hypothetical protein ABZV34_27045 [Streptomyces sp. NPDC005195]|uniref:hypothetical protein n=1 Tax=Streptomyces sp. NPDC005195 TaxID=3154561 RepID=UPI0033AC81CB
MPDLSTVTEWNINKPHQCPQCAHDTVAVPSRWEVFTCCNCGTRFARFPRLQRFLHHTGITCEVCTQRIPVPVDGQPFGFLRRRHAGRGIGAPTLFEAWLQETDYPHLYRAGDHYLNTRTSRVDAMAELAWRRSMFGPVEDDPSPVVAVVAEEETFKFGLDATDEQRRGFREGTVEVYSIGVLRQIPTPHPRRGQFYADRDTFNRGVAIAPAGLEGLYTHPQHLPEPLAAYAPQLRP